MTIRGRLEIFVREFGELRQMPQQSRLQRLAAVDRNRKPYDAAALTINVVATADALQGPATPLNDPGELATGY
jgi:cytochrome c556